MILKIPGVGPRVFAGENCKGGPLPKNGPPFLKGGPPRKPPKFFAAPSAPRKKPPYTHIFTFYCSFKKQFFENIAKICSKPYVLKFLLFISFLRNNFPPKKLKFSKTAPSAPFLGTLPENHATLTIV